MSSVLISTVWHMLRSAYLPSVLNGHFRGSFTRFFELDLIGGWDDDCLPFLGSERPPEQSGASVADWGPIMVPCRRCGHSPDRPIPRMIRSTRLRAAPALDGTALAPRETEWRIPEDPLPTLGSHPR